jgi:biopolymer transport protein ExbB
MEWLKLAVDYGIIGLLIMMSVTAVAIAVERYLTYRNVRIADFADKKSSSTSSPP